MIAAAGAHPFARLATVIDLAFARWDLAHLSEFRFADGTRIGKTDWGDTDTVTDARTKLGRVLTVADKASTRRCACGSSGRRAP